MTLNLITASVRKAGEMAEELGEQLPSPHDLPPVDPPDDDDDGDQNIVFRQLNSDDVGNLGAGIGLLPKGVGGTILEHVLGHEETETVSSPHA